MGGKAIMENNDTKESADRIDNYTFEILVSMLVPELKAMFEKVHVLQHVKEKIDHGDLDIIVSDMKSNINKKDMIENIKKLLNSSKDPVINNNTHSFERKDDIVNKTYQIDINICNPNKFDMICDYKDYGDFGGIVGFMARYFHQYHGHGPEYSLIYGENGLELDIYFYKGCISSNITEQKERILLTNSMSSILSFFDMCYDKYKKDFDTYSSIFEYAISSKYFNPDMYMSQDDNKRYRRRRSRNMYKLWMDYITVDFKSIILAVITYILVFIGIYDNSKLTKYTVKKVNCKSCTAYFLNLLRIKYNCNKNKSNIKLAYTDILKHFNKDIAFIEEKYKLDYRTAVFYDNNVIKKVYEMLTNTNISKSPENGKKFGMFKSYIKAQNLEIKDVIDENDVIKIYHNYIKVL